MSTLKKKYHLNNCGAFSLKKGFRATPFQHFKIKNLWRVFLFYSKKEKEDGQEESCTRIQQWDYAVLAEDAQQAAEEGYKMHQRNLSMTPKKVKENGLEVLESRVSESAPA